MDRNYWEKIAVSYNEEIFDVLHNDSKKLILSAIKKYSSKKKTVLDAGCAVGKWLPALSPLFKKVYALDISAKNLEIAKKNHSLLPNIVYQRADMSGRKEGIPKCDVAICINAILTDSLKKRTIFFQSLMHCLKKKGNLILTVPSLESALLTKIINNQFRIDSSTAEKNITAKNALKKWKDLQQGNLDIDYVPTKHYLKEELSYLLNYNGFRITRFKKIEYSWTTEFISPPQWLKDPYPWDWMVVAQKN
ncbi:MAG: methyltransferase domain-containing protein [Bacteroidetes bacterium]|nr:methyltransferase domain-containing protein [Bacteroidota bacterium]MBS1633098.1 methyltransferase domain-containing protein [Bacteroidota bacterium]